MNVGKKAATHTFPIIQNNIFHTTKKVHFLKPDMKVDNCHVRYYNIYEIINSLVTRKQWHAIKTF